MPTVVNPDVVDRSLDPPPIVTRSILSVNVRGLRTSWPEFISITQLEAPPSCDSSLGDSHSTICI